VYAFEELLFALKHIVVSLKLVRALSLQAQPLDCYYLPNYTGLAQTI
jgi:hypothetical protein